MVKIAKLRARYEPIYKGLNPIWCPAIKSMVVFNSRGWKHLRFDGTGKRRDPKDLIMRLKLIPSISSVIENARSIKIYRRKDVLYYLITQEDERNIRVVLRKVRNGKTHFYSIFRGNKTKKPSK